jgi:hypothetical protein
MLGKAVWRTCTYTALLAASAYSAQVGVNALRPSPELVLTGTGMTVVTISFCAYTRTVPKAAALLHVSTRCNQHLCFVYMDT